MPYVRTFLLLALLTGLFLVIGALIAGRQGMIIAFVIALAMNLFAYWNSDRMVLSMYGAREVDEARAPQLFALVRDLARRAGLPMPKVYMIESDQPNAFATGRNPEHAAVAINTGLLRLLSPEEVAGVVAHELSHVRHRDTLTMTMTAVIAGAIGMLANFAFFFGGMRGDRREGGGGLGAIAGLAVMLFAPLAATLVQLAISRTREVEADRAGAEISGHPLWLAPPPGTPRPPRPTRPRPIFPPSPPCTPAPSPASPPPPRPPRSASAASRPWLPSRARLPSRPAAGLGANQTPRPAFAQLAMAKPTAR